MNMQRLTLQLATLLALFFGAWLLLGKAPWMDILHLKKAGLNAEQRLGDKLWDILSRSETELHNPALTVPADSMLKRICNANSIDESTIHLHILKKNEVNAFALPGGHLVVYTGLIAACKNESELMGVIAHELTHIRKNHVMKKLVREIGVSALTAVAGGNGGGTVREAARILSSSAYDRTLEREADRGSADYMIRAHADAGGLPRFLLRLAKTDTLPEAAYWISSHPESRERAETLSKYLKGKKYTVKPLLDNATWANMQETSARFNGKQER
jgi:predicted Zn-dependent protease